MDARKPIRSYKDLIAWQKAMDLVVEIYRITKRFPPEEQFGLTAQMRRAAVSIPSNIAEGYGRNTTKEYRNFLRISIGSNCELETQITAAHRLEYVTAVEYSTLELHIGDVGKLLYRLRQSIF